MITYLKRASLSVNYIQVRNRYSNLMLTATKILIDRLSKEILVT